ncbi:MarR family winged helix-turn-helix transcriptional regulator [Streptomyces sp. HNM0574]|uniref:MarR family winged helix-turn-helix transcriptional regulator n=1 Tax=Streptomyces sp. HNM0574 TaxID=2714954 RepID=UPI00146BDC22|nr:MarR family winged helix-turn-helix transcriptional regulator [Streptomyces sp. HNM0574]NLU70827.1 winged helix-turn-helix transcriptional regulator [Streptomyces sp. HNM0574]
MEYSHDDEGLAGQPIGYWSGAAAKAIVGHIRDALAGYGLTQPQWWVLNQAAEAGPAGCDRATMLRTLGGYPGPGDDLEADTDALITRALLTPDGPRLRLTPEGATLHDEVATRQDELRARIHAGIPNEEYVIALKVLQRMIANVGGSAWHH